jgi:hypothetical protein
VLYCVSPISEGLSGGIEDKLREASVRITGFGRDSSSGSSKYAEGLLSTQHRSSKKIKRHWCPYINSKPKNLIQIKGKKVKMSLYLITRWRWVVTFMHLPLYRRRKSPRYPLHRRLGGPQSRSGRCGEDINFLPLTGIELEPSSPKFIIQIWHNKLNRNSWSWLAYEKLQGHQILRTSRKGICFKSFENLQPEPVTLKSPPHWNSKEKGTSLWYIIAKQGSCSKIFPALLTSLWRYEYKWRELLQKFHFVVAYFRVVKCKGMELGMSKLSYRRRWRTATW